MAEISLMWGGTTVGDAGPYTDDKFSDMLDMLSVSDRAVQGVLPTTRAGFTGELAVTNAGGSTARVATGVALVDGKLYTNSANVDFTVSGASIYWIVGLRKSWAAQTVRAFARGNYASAALALASLVQTDSTTWEIPLATVLTTAGGAVSAVTDARKFVRMVSAMEFIDASIIFNDTDNLWHGSTTVATIYLEDTKDEWLFARWIVPDDYAGDLAIFLCSVAAASDVVFHYYWERRDATTFTLLAYGISDYTGTLAAGENLEMNPTGVVPGSLICMAYNRDAADVADLLNANFLVYGIKIYYTRY